MKLGTVTRHDLAMASRAGRGALQGKHHDFRRAIATMVGNEALGCELQTGDADLRRAVRVGLDPSVEVDLRHLHRFANACLEFGDVVVVGSIFGHGRMMFAPLIKVKQSSESLVMVRNLDIPEVQADQTHATASARVRDGHPHGRRPALASSLRAAGLRSDVLHDRLQPDPAFFARGHAHVVR